MKVKLLSSMCRIVDLSPVLVPGQGDRRLEIRPYVYEADKTIMHDVDMMSHLGVHVEAPSHYRPELPDVASLPLSSFMGDAIVLDIGPLGRDAPVTSQALNDMSETGGVRPHDILLLQNSRDKAHSPYIGAECARWMASLPIKMLGIGESVKLEEPGQMHVHDSLLTQRIPIIERLTNLGALDRERFFFVGLPLPIKGLDSSPIRAIALIPEE